MFQGVQVLFALALVGWLTSSQLDVRSYFHASIAMFSNTSIVAYVLGLLTFILAPRLLGAIRRLFNYGLPPRRDIYGLEHALLNMKLQCG